MELPKCRLFLVAPSNGDEVTAAACLDAALGAGDVASLLLRPKLPGVPGAMIEKLLPQAQRAGVAVLIEGDTRVAARLKADGVEVPAGRPLEDIALARKALPAGAIVGADAGSSRHTAMELAEAGADYIVLEGRESDGEARAVWWAEVAMVPAVASGDFSAAEIATLADRGVEFVRVEGDWSSPEAMARHIAALVSAEAAP